MCKVFWAILNTELYSVTPLCFLSSTIEDFCIHQKPMLMLKPKHKINPTTNSLNLKTLLTTCAECSAVHGDNGETHRQSRLSIDTSSDILLLSRQSRGGGAGGVACPPRQFFSIRKD